jgi:hypothetical protein
MYRVIKCLVRGNKACVKNADLRHPSCTVVMYRHKSASPIHNVLTEKQFPQLHVMPLQYVTQVDLTSLTAHTSSAQ